LSHTGSQLKTPQRTTALACLSWPLNMMEVAQRGARGGRGLFPLTCVGCSFFPSLGLVQAV
jgi:hypothetical protein